MRISTSEFLLGSLGGILSQESTINQLNQEIASGETMQTPMDDPAGAGLALNVASQIGQLTVDTANAQAGQQSIQNGLASLQGVGTLLAQVRDTAVQAANGTTSSANRQSLAGTVESALQQLLQLANSQAANGEYLFGGSQTGAAPFAVGADGAIVFSGDAGTSSVQIAPGMSVPITVSGQNIFMNVPSGNGSLSVAASGSNTGTAYGLPGGVSNQAQLQAEHLAGTEFVVSFSAAPGGSLSYTVASGTGSPGSAGFAASSGTVASGSFSPGSGIDFGGMNVGFTGTPAAGDAFTIATSQNTSIFQILGNLVTALNGSGPAASSSVVQQQIENAIAEIDSVQNNVLGGQATLGSNLSDIETVQSRDATASSSAQAQLSNLQSANLPQVITNYNESIVSLQAAESAFARIQNLSLFSVIGA